MAKARTLHSMSLETFNNFLLAGRAVFTVVSKKSGEHLTYKVRADKKDPEHRHYVQVAKGYNDFIYIGWIKDQHTFSLSANSKASWDALSVRTFNWIFANRKEDKLLEQATLMHEGKCGRCGRNLTDPISISLGLGSECRKFTR